MEQGFYDVKKTKISHNCASCGPTVVESEFLAQIKGKINISIDFEMSYLIMELVIFHLTDAPHTYPTLKEDFDC